MNTIYYLSNKYYDVKSLEPRSISVIEYPDSILKYRAKGYYYTLFPPSWKSCFSSRHIRANLKNNAFPCVDLCSIYAKDSLDPERYAQGKILKTLIKNTTIVFYYKDNKLIPHIPPHILLEHLSEWVGLSVEYLRSRIAISNLKVIMLLGIKENEWNSLSDVDLKLL